MNNKQIGSKQITFSNKKQCDTFTKIKNILVFPWAHPYENACGKLAARNIHGIIICIIFFFIHLNFSGRTCERWCLLTKLSLPGPVMGSDVCFLCVNSIINSGGNNVPEKSQILIIW